jgi:predicted ribosomally synthesized peptide with SipW-like signal peptide
MVADHQPSTHPGKTKTKVCLVLLLATAATTASMTAQTTAQPMLHAGWVLNDSFVLDCFPLFV